MKHTFEKQGHEIKAIKMKQDGTKDVIKRLESTTFVLLTKQECVSTEVQRIQSDLQTTQEKVEDAHQSTAQRMDDIGTGLQEGWKELSRLQLEHQELHSQLQENRKDVKQLQGISTPNSDRMHLVTQSGNSIGA